MPFTMQEHITHITHITHNNCWTFLLYRQQL